MKTTSVIVFTAFAAVLLASAKVNAEDTCDQLGGQPLPVSGLYFAEASKKYGKENPIQIILCLINMITTGEISFEAALQCFTRNGIQTFAQSMTKFVNFKIMNGGNVAENGEITNGTLTWGKWQKDGKDVPTINGTKFDNKQAATFTAMGSEGGAGPKGTFNIHEAGKNVAFVQFNIPLAGQNWLNIKPADTSYLCKHSMSSGASPTVDITCNKK